jgi:hypothetical protein
MKDICIVFVCNKKYYNKFLYTYNKLITVGKYKDDVTLVIGDDLEESDIKIKNINVVKFKDIKFNDKFYNINNTIQSDGRNISKKFQWHKLHLFNTYFKKWKYIFYLDCGMKIYNDITPMLSEFKDNKVVAHSDSFPSYNWKLYGQFDTSHSLYEDISKKFNMNINYFQTTILLYDTSIITDTLFDDLYKLSLQYPISKTNEQGIMALYFTNKNIWEQIKIKNEKTYYYDYLKRNKKDKYIMTKI